MSHMNNPIINKFKKALDTENIPVIEFMVNEDIIDDLNINNSKKENVLHVLCKNYSRLQNGGGTIRNILKKSSGIDINQQDADGNTAIINAVSNDADGELCSLLEEYGADRRIKNHKGLRVRNLDIDNEETEASDDVSDAHNDTEYSLNSSDAQSSVQAQFGGGKPLYRAYNDIESETVNSNFVDIFLRKREDVAVTETDDTLRSLGINGGGDQSESTKYFDNIVNAIKLNKSMAESSIDSENLNTEKIVHKIMNSYKRPSDKNNHVGGGDSVVARGKRMLKLNELTESMSGGDMSNVESESDNSEHGGKNVNSKFGHYARQLSRLLDNQQKEVFERVVNKVMELMKVDNETARMYKTTLIRMAKKKNENLVGLDLANEVEKLATTDVLKKIDINKEKKAILKWREENNKTSDSKKSASMSSSDSEVKTKKTAAAKKPKQSKSESGFSESTDKSNVSEISLNDFSVSSA